MQNITDIVRAFGAAEVGAIRYEECTVINPQLANRLQFTPKTVIIGIVPYYTKYCDEPRTVSAYALAYDYHRLLRSICDSAVEKLKEKYPEFHFEGFADHSPIHEKLAAAKAGLGILGDHSLLITEKYSSFVFLFEIITDLETVIPVYDIGYCEHCGACKRACPADIDNKATCLSVITQKKGELARSEIDMIKRNGYVWGCDICQLACPHTKKAISERTIYTDSAWFNSDIIASPDGNTVADAADFAMRAYSWRGKQTILRNILLMNN